MESEYAFVAWIGSILTYVVFLLWAFAPQHVLHSIGITYYPSKYYALALPAYVIVVYLLGNMLYVGLNMFSTLDPTSINTLEDCNTNVDTASMEDLKEGAVPEFADLDPCLVSRVLYRFPPPPPIKKRQSRSEHRR